MESQMLEFLKTMAVALISSGGFTVIITKYFEKHSSMNLIKAQIADMEKVLDRHGEALEKLVKCQMELLTILHEKNVINGESQQLRKEFSDYMYGSQAAGFKIKKKKVQ